MVYHVSDLNKYIKDLLESDPHLSQVSVRGEIGAKISGSSHKYFELIDNRPGQPTASINCVIWQSNVSRCAKALKPGKSLVLSARINYYLVRGTISLSVQNVLEDGEGSREQELRAIRRRLKEDGLTNPERKRRLPFLPRKIGLITAESGAALQDVLRQAHNRYARLQLLLAPAQVQGNDALDSLLQSIEDLQQPELGCDIILLTRGGGSPEDLHIFNNERLARAVAASKVPIVTAIGHEIDHLIVDDVSDRSFPTPTAAAQGIIPDLDQIIFQLEDSMERMTDSIDRKVSFSREQFSRLLEFSRVLRDPAVLLYDKKEQVEELRRRMLDSAQNRFNNARSSVDKTADLNQLMKHFLESCRHRLSLLSEKSRAYSPQSTLDRGYAIVEKDGQVLRKVDQFKPGTTANLRFADGNVQIERAD